MKKARVVIDCFCCFFLSIFLLDCVTFSDIIKNGYSNKMSVIPSTDDYDAKKVNCLLKILGHGSCLIISLVCLSFNGALTGCLHPEISLIRAPYRCSHVRGIFVYPHSYTFWFLVFCFGIWSLLTLCLQSCPGTSKVMHQDCSSVDLLKVNFV